MLIVYIYGVVLLYSFVCWKNINWRLALIIFNGGKNASAYIEKNNKFSGFPSALDSRAQHWILNMQAVTIDITNFSKVKLNDMSCKKWRSIIITNVFCKIVHFLILLLCCKAFDYTYDVLKRESRSCKYTKKSYNIVIFKTKIYLLNHT